MKNSNYIIIGLVVALILLLGANVAILLRYQQDMRSYQNNITNLETEVARQRDEKNTVRNLWEEQAAASDKLIIAQTNLINRIGDYQLEVKRSIRFVNSQPELLSTISEERLTNATDDIALEIANIEEKTKENIEAKNKAKQVIDTLYLYGGEEQDNRANPRNTTP